MKRFTLEKILQILLFLSFTAAFLVITYLAISNADAPHKTESIKEYEKYINIIDNNSAVTVCTKRETEWRTVPTGIRGGSITKTSSHCIEELCINNKQELIDYINHKYGTDILMDIEIYNKKIEEYKNAKNNK